MENNNTNKSVIKGGATFVELLQIAFIILKLCKVIEWSWWLVLLPTIISVGAVLILLLGGAALLTFLTARNKRKIERLKKEVWGKKYDV